MSARHSFPPPASPEATHAAQLEESVAERAATQSAAAEHGAAEHGAEESSGPRLRRHLSMVGPQVASALERRPRDGWKRARLFPMGRGARRALKGLIKSMCPTSLDAPQGTSIEHHVEVYVRFFMCYMPRWMARGIWLALFLVEWSPLWLGQAARRLSALPPRRRARVIARLAHSRFYPVRRLVMVLNSLFMSAYFDSVRVHRALRYAPVPFIKDRIALRRELLGGAPETS